MRALHTSASSSARRWLCQGLMTIVLVGGCQDQNAAAHLPGGASAGPGSHTSVAAAVPTPPNDGLPVLANLKPDGSFAHNPDDFTQGLVFADGALFESTGRTGESKLRRLNCETGQVEQTQEVGAEHFGEGLASYQDSLYQLTWTSQVCLVYDRATLKPKNQLFYSTQGWGLTLSPKEQLFAFTDGSSSVRFLDPNNLITKRKVTVLNGKGAEVDNLNELEWVQGELWANVWLTDRIARIDPQTGKILSWILFTDLMNENHRESEDVLNGMAYDPASDRLWITGKLWPKTYRFDGVKAKFFASKAKS